MATPDYIDVERRGAIYIVTLKKPPQNRLTTGLCQALIDTYRQIEKELLRESTQPEGAVILRGNDNKFFCTVLDVLCFAGKLQSNSEHTGRGPR